MLVFKMEVIVIVEAVSVIIENLKEEKEVVMPIVIIGNTESPNS
jgi:hypothetical protein